ncbi:RidA family protein [Rhodococcus rhodnii]|uniref:RidA family protein n=1 Tax=Rhodococcus rhodnii TaxID=38312 RepID=UPI0027D8CF3D|nr:RidA family protein [Rhodococcus rhodnii]
MAGNLPVPQGRYVPARRVHSIVRTAGMTPRVDGRLLLTGRVGDDVDVLRARDAAAVAVGNALAAARSLVAVGERLRCAELIVYVACTADFTELSTVADGASDVIAAEFGSDELPARSAVGVHALPGGSPVEVSLSAEVVAAPGERDGESAAVAVRP